VFADHFSALAARYAAYRPLYPAVLVEALADACARTEVAWDAGCGNGQLSVGLATRFARVIATDPSKAQVDAAEPHARVAYAVGAAEDSGLPAASADLVVAAQAAHWFEWPRFVAEAQRVARPGGVLAVVSYGAIVMDGEPGAALARYQADVAGSWPPGREHVDNGYRDLCWPTPALALDVPPVMTAAWTRDELFGYVTSWSATNRHGKAHGPARLVALQDELARAWPDGGTREIRWPLVVKATLCGGSP
jgi:SAM-dependent methyltransferase